MQIKHIGQFRTNWRNEQGYQMSNWDEHFIGANHEGKSGFYKMVNGIVENIKADLTPKLQNAQDEQAIYEFLQNAADSRATECAVVYDADYFMVLNNGSPFTEKDLKALLNSFQGTKADKNKAENCDKIGRYGIGFKLAYRLMGKLDGAEELLRDLAGPLLFSWHKATQLQQLLNYQQGEKLEMEGNDDAPWLLKIILACFPCAPNETVKDLMYSSNILFQERELMEMVRFLSKHQTLLQSLSMEQGSLFFLKFGTKKHEKLRESLLNIQSGIGYSMNTLKTLQKVILLDKTVERHPVQTERFSILPGTEDFRRIDPEFSGCPIDILLGFPQTTEQSIALKAAPSLYQFFPMRNERHGLAFFIHSTSFAKITDRTRLDDQGEANMETFQYLANALKKQMNRYKMDDFDRYAHIYKALLLSDKSKEYDAQLQNKYFYDPLLQYIQVHIPTRKRSTFPKDLVVIKRTKLPVEPMSFGIGKEWFYWTDGQSDEAVLRDAANSTKLGLKAWTLRDLLLEGNASLINTWIEDLEEGDYQTFMEELKALPMEGNLLQKFKEIKCFKFSDNRGNRCFYAIDDLRQADNLFLIHTLTVPIRSEIKALGFSVLEFDVMEHSSILQQVESQLDYLSNEKALAAKLAARTAQAVLSPAQKLQLFRFLLGLKGLSNDDLRQIVLFQNRKGMPVKLQGLLAAEAAVPAWLEDYKIAPQEDNSELQGYLVGTNLWEAYTHIIVPHWTMIAQAIAAMAAGAEQTIATFYQQVVALSALRPLQPKLTTAACIYTDAEQGFLLASQVFYHKALISLAEVYTPLRSALQKTLGVPIPALEVLPLLANDPFRLAETTGDKEWKQRQTDWLQRITAQSLTPAEKGALFALLWQLLAPKDWGQLRLFCNKKHIQEPASRLLSNALQVPAWLEDYKIHPEEESAGMQEVLVQEADIFTQIISTEWNQIVQHPTVRKDIAAFYESVAQYAGLGKGAKPLTHLPYIYTGEETGFVSAAACFYHPAFAQCEDYKSLRTALRTLTHLQTPHPATLPFLSTPLFKTKETVFGRALEADNMLLLREELSALQQFLDQTNEDFFVLLCIEEQAGNQREYIVTRRTHRTFPVYLDKAQQKLADQIRQRYAETYKILPHKLYVSTYRNKGLMSGAQLFEQLSKSKDTPADLMSAMLSESGNNALQQQVFNKIEKIVLRQGQVYPKESFEHQALQLFRNKDADYGAVRAKIWIETVEGKSLRLNEIAFEPTVTFTIDRFGKYSLQLAAILPRFGVLQTICEGILEQLQGYEAPTVLKRRCFESGERPAKDILAELKRDFPVLSNASQLAFVLLMVKETGNEQVLRDFKIKTIGATDPILLSQYEMLHIQPLPFVLSQAVIDPTVYGGIESLLKLGEKRLALEFGARRLALAPYFDKNMFYCSPLRAIATDETPEVLQGQLLEYAYRQWAALEPMARPVECQLYTGTAGMPAGLDMEQFVYPAAWALAEEQLPAWLVDWLGEVSAKEDHGSFCEVAPTIPDTEEQPADHTATTTLVWVPAGKLGFLYALGVNTSKSDLVALRRYLHLQQGEPTSQRQLNDLRSQQKNFLEKTIYWLAAQQTLFTSDNERVIWLRKLYNSLEQFPSHLPLPLIVAVQPQKDDERFTYQLSTGEMGEVYGMDSRQQNLLRERHKVSAQTILAALQQKGDYFTNLELKGIELKTTKIEEELDTMALEKNSQEWAAPHYLKWKNEVPYQVRLYPKQMPYRLQFLGVTVKQYERDNAVLCEQIAYVCRQVPNIEEALFGIARAVSLNEQFLLQLLRYKNEGVKEASHQVIEQIAVEELLEADEEVIESPSVEQLKTYQKQPNSRLKVAFDLEHLPQALLEELMQHAKKAKMIVKKNSNK